MANIILLSSEQVTANFKNYKLGQIDGTKAQTLSAFYTEIEKALHLPDFEPDMDLLDSLLNDLSWIKQPNVAIYISNFDSFLAREKEKTLAELLNLLDVIAEDWKWLDDDDSTPKKNLKLLIQNCPRAVTVLEKEEFAFAVL
ncbi:barstar family protein [Runella slithyformis]|uniref:Barstar (Barnase inhibitor) n=1 Tax=Runella slithyformis (strain ATCC 29530 / DSM 19594 / LMG 11500 / NCIMB 11436 / LSU 4) TaxID=761193 RepID=A0A7U3ZIB7_RUNSL|nr:barstar family protein [Runella slithyformis]AEI47745.1 barstar (barnase inhibitor) [Runella slithyformis DSM 19594]